MINAVLVGNPNCGKTTLFNALTGSDRYVGNWPGVTVEKAEGRLKNNRHVIITDLPGIYSLSPYSTEEAVTKGYLDSQKIDIIINIIDATNLERNLFLTTQLANYGIPMIIALNMMDEVAKKKININTTLLSRLLGCNVISISAIKSLGIHELINAIVKKNSDIPIKRYFKTNALRYQYISNIINTCVKQPNMHTDMGSTKIDKIVTNKFLAFPIFFTVMFTTYYFAVTLIGKNISTFIADCILGNGFKLFDIYVPGLENILRVLLTKAECHTILQSLILDGILPGVRSVLGFIPQIFALFFMLAFFESSGYMSRIAYILDRVFKKLGLSGKSFIPVLLGTGCGVSGIMASRTIESGSGKRITAVTTTFIPCSAKMPVIALIAGTLFDNTYWIAPSTYLIGVASIIVSAWILKKFRAFKIDNTPFIMELPPYRMPALSSLFKSANEKVTAFIKKAGTVILLTSAAVWFLIHYGIVNGIIMITDIDNSFLAIIAKKISFIFTPLGFGNWQSVAATLTGLTAKESIISTFSIIAGKTPITEYISALFCPASGYSFMIFNLLCAPCFAALYAMHRELNDFKLTMFAFFYQCSFAYAVAFLSYVIIKELIIL